MGRTQRGHPRAEPASYLVPVREPDTSQVRVTSASRTPAQVTPRTGPLTPVPQDEDTKRRHFAKNWRRFLQFRNSPLRESSSGRGGQQRAQPDQTKPTWRPSVPAARPDGRPTGLAGPVELSVDPPPTSKVPQKALPSTDSSVTSSLVGIHSPASYFLHRGHRWGTAPEPAPTRPAGPGPTPGPLRCPARGRPPPASAACPVSEGKKRKCVLLRVVRSTIQTRLFGPNTRLIRRTMRSSRGSPISSTAASGPHVPTRPRRSWHG